MSIAFRTQHSSVLIREVCSFLADAPAVRGASTPLLFDGTLGAGGHAAALLSAIPNAVLVATDRDASAVARARSRLATYGERARLVHANFGELASMTVAGVDDLRFDGLLLDLGISSDQLDDPARGFSFRSDAPLDMRMDTSRGRSAAEILNFSEATELRRIFREGGVGAASGPLARAVVEDRPLATASEFAALCERVVRPLARKGVSRKGMGTSHHPATVPFQALRIATNDEFGSLRSFLSAAPDLMKPGARLAVIAFHSLEDQEVTRVMRRWGRKSETKRGLPAEPAMGKLLTPEAVRPSAEERETNPRARSALLRVFERSIENEN